MPNGKANPCKICGSNPKTTLFTDENASIRCRNINCPNDDGVYGSTEDEAIDAWNKMNPLKV